MKHDFNFQNVLAASLRGAWTIADILPADTALDFTCGFLPEALARSAASGLPSAEEQRTLNHVRAHEYLSMFGLVEEFILPFLLDHVRPQLDGCDYRVRALLNFAGEEAKHIQLFKIFHQRFLEGFGIACEVIGPPQAIAAEVLKHDPLSVALLVLHIEWMSQRHYIESVRDDGTLDPLFRSLLKHHWIEEAQHAKLDMLIIEALAAGRDEAGIGRAIDGYLELGAFLDGGLKVQVEFNLDALERASGRVLAGSERVELALAQLQALRWTYIGSGMTHPKFAATLAALSPTAAQKIADLAPTFC